MNVLPKQVVFILAELGVQVIKLGLYPQKIVARPHFKWRRIAICAETQGYSSGDVHTNIGPNMKVHRPKPSFLAQTVWKTKVGIVIPHLPGEGC